MGVLVGGVVGGCVVPFNEVPGTACTALFFAAVTGSAVDTKSTLSGYNVTLLWRTRPAGSCLKDSWWSTESSTAGARSGLCPTPHAMTRVKLVAVMLLQDTLSFRFVADTQTCFTISPVEVAICATISCVLVVPDLVEV